MAQHDQGGARDVGSALRLTQPTRLSPWVFLQGVQHNSAQLWRTDAATLARSIAVGISRAMTNTLPVPVCWICGDVATTAEHMTNQSILRLFMGEPAPGNPFFFNSRAKKNRHVQGVNTNLLKPVKDLCGFCNSTRTQPHDFALETLLRWMKARKPPVVPGMILRPRQIFGHDAARQLLNLHLYFVKKLGCLVVQARHEGTPMPVDITKASQAIMTGRPHPHLYLRLGCSPPSWPTMVGRADPDSIHDQLHRRLVWLDWCHYFGPYAVHVIFAEEVMKHHWMLADAWHPRDGVRKLRLSGIDKPIDFKRSKGALRL